MRSPYRDISVNATLQDIVQWALDATRARRFDLDDYDTQIAQNPLIYDVPADSNDLIGTEKVGDIAADPSYFYIVVDNAGSLEWRRVAINTF